MEIKHMPYQKRKEHMEREMRIANTISKDKMFRYGFFIIRKLVNHGFQAHIVGGSVRNLILNVPVKDVDICTNATPADVKRIFDGFSIVCVGESFGTTNVIVDSIQFEITTYRGEQYTEGSRKPECIFNPTGDAKADLMTDLSRRDFTMNTLIMNEDGKIEDHFKGMEHMSRHLICPVGNADTMLMDDPLRILRAFRFSAQLDFLIHKDLQKSIKKNSHRLESISNERVMMELTKLIMSENRRSLVSRFNLMHRFGVWDVIMPEIVDIFGFDQNNKHHDFHLGIHTALAIHHSPVDFHVRWAMLLHDIGKIKCCEEKPCGELSFPGHADESETMARELLHRLRFSRKDSELICGLIRFHDLRFHNFKNKSMRKVLAELGDDGASKLFDVWSADVYSQKVATPNESIIELRESISKFITFMNSDRNVDVLNMEINGNDIVKLGVKPGKIIGDILNLLNDWVVKGIVPNDKKVLIKNAEKLLTDWTANGILIK